MKESQGEGGQRWGGLERRAWAKDWQTGRTERDWSVDGGRRDTRCSGIISPDLFKHGFIHSQQRFCFLGRKHFATGSKKKKQQPGAQFPHHPSVLMTHRLPKGSKNFTNKFLLTPLTNTVLLQSVKHERVVFADRILASPKNLGVGLLSNITPSALPPRTPTPNPDPRQTLPPAEPYVTCPLVSTPTFIVVIIQHLAFTALPDKSSQ